MMQMPQATGLETTHTFADGMYARRLFIPRGTSIVSKTHARECMFFILSGKLSIYRDDGAFADSIEGPVMFIAPPGKRAVRAETDVVCMTVHRLDNPQTRDLAEVEAQVIVPEEDVPLLDVHNQPVPQNILEAH